MKSAYFSPPQSIRPWLITRTDGWIRSSESVAWIAYPASPISRSKLGESLIFSSGALSRRRSISTNKFLVPICVSSFSPQNSNAEKNGNNGSEPWPLGFRHFADVKPSSLTKYLKKECSTKQKYLWNTIYIWAHDPLLYCITSVLDNGQIIGFQSGSGTSQNNGIRSDLRGNILWYSPERVIRELLPITLNNELHYIGLVKETYRNTIPEWPGNVVYQELGIDSIYWFSDEIFTASTRSGYSVSLDFLIKAIWSRLTPNLIFWLFIIVILI